MSKRRNRILRLEKMIGAFNDHRGGEYKHKVMAIFMINSGVMKSTAYEYLGVLKDASRVVEDKVEHRLYLAEQWEALRKVEKLRELAQEAELAKVNSLDAYNLEDHA